MTDACTGALRPGPANHRVSRNASVAASAPYLAFAILALAPIVVVAALRIPLINQLNFADAWFYTGYAFVPKHHFAIFGFNYFAVRFPPILAIGGFERVFGAGDGYVLLRYVLAVMSGVSIYLCVRRFASVAVATGAALLLYLDPFFSRMLLWDYSGFIEVACGVSGIALWFWADGRRLRYNVLPGVALAAAVFANALFGTALLVFVLVETMAAIRAGRRGVARYLLRLGVLVASAIVVFGVGYLSYLAILGSLSPVDLIRPILRFLSQNNQLSAPYRRPVASWLLHEPRIWAPVITSVALVATLRWRLMGRDIAARLAQLCIGYTAFLWLYRFAITSSAVETWYAYSVVIVATAPALGVLLSELTNNAFSNTRHVISVCAAFALTALLIRDIPGPVGTMYSDVDRHRGFVAALLAVGISAALACAVRSRLRPAAFALLAVVLAVMSYAPDVLDGRGTTGLFVTSGSKEWTAYKASARFLGLVRNHDSRGARVFLWFPGVQGYVSLTWSDLPQTGDTLNEIGLDQPVSRLTPLGAARLKTQPVKYVLILAPRKSQLRSALFALERGGFSGSVVRTGQLVGDDLSFDLFSLAGR